MGLEIPKPKIMISCIATLEINLKKFTTKFLKVISNKYSDMISFKIEIMSLFLKKCGKSLKKSMMDFLNFEEQGMISFNFIQKF